MSRTKLPTNLSHSISRFSFGSWKCINSKGKWATSRSKKKKKDHFKKRKRNQRREITWLAGWRRKEAATAAAVDRRVETARSKKAKVGSEPKPKGCRGSDEWKREAKKAAKVGRVAAKLVSNVGFWFRFQPRPGLWREGEGWFFICVKWNYKNAIIAVRFGFYNFWTENWTEPKNAIIRSVRFLLIRFLIQKIPNRKPKKTNPSDFFFYFGLFLFTLLESVRESFHRDVKKGERGLILLHSGCNEGDKGEKFFRTEVLGYRTIVKRKMGLAKPI